MALTGLDIFKLLPKTNCKDCGHATCLAFAMALATGKAGLEQCSHASDTAREAIGSASERPVSMIKIGTGEKEIRIGDENVLFRHDKTFENECAIAIRLSDLLTDLEIKERVKKINDLVFERVGHVCEVDLIAIVNESGKADRFAQTVGIVSSLSQLPLVLVSTMPSAMETALILAAKGRPLICGANGNNYKEMTKLAREQELPLVVQGKSLEDMHEIVENVVSLGWKQLVLDSGRREVGPVLADLTQIRRSALKKNRTLGYPAITFVNNNDQVQAVLDASVYITKYSGIIVLDSIDPADLLALITLRLNIYSDPQKPATIESKLYGILAPGAEAPVYITTNFSLTYYCVAGDVEASKIPSYILPVDTDGTSVLTAWAAGKFTPEIITESLIKHEAAKRVSCRKLVLPGGVASFKERLKELSGWDVLVGPHESAGIPAFIKRNW